MDGFGAGVLTGGTAITSCSASHGRGLCLATGLSLSSAEAAPGTPSLGAALLQLLLGTGSHKHNAALVGLSVDRKLLMD